MSDDIILETKGLTKHYGGVHALNDANVVYSHLAEQDLLGDLVMVGESAGGAETSASSNAGSSASKGTASSTRTRRSSSR